MKRVYIVNLWNAWEKTMIGIFETKQDAEKAVRMAKRFYFPSDETFQERLAIGLAGFEITPQTIGFERLAKIAIDFGKAQEKEG